MSIRSPSGTSVAGDRVDDSSATGVLSPVSPASSISSVAATRIRPSAGTLSPASKPTMSPGHQLLGRDLDALAVAADVRRHDQHLAERGDALGRLALLVQPHHRVEDGQAEDDQPGRDVLQGDDADHRRADAAPAASGRGTGAGTPSSPAPWPPRPACSARTAAAARPPRPRSDRPQDRRPAGGRRPRPTADTSRSSSAAGVVGVTVATITHLQRAQADPSVTTRRMRPAPPAAPIAGATPDRSPSPSPLHPPFVDCRPLATRDQRPADSDHLAQRGGRTPPAGG